MYENDSAVSQYCQAHYGEDYYNVENFPLKCVRLALGYMIDRPKIKALDLGCAVGRSSFELARAFDSVDGLDFSARFIRIAFQMKQKGSIHFELQEEGDIISYHEKKLEDLGLEQSKHKVEFFQADASNLKPQFTGYDLILAANLIDRLYDPVKFLTAIHSRLNTNGVLVLTSPYTWLEEITKKENWVGGVRKDGEPYTTLEGLIDILSPHFKMLDAPRDIEFVIRETRRKFQHTISQMTVWGKI